MHDMFDLNKDGEIDSFEQMLEYDFIDSHDRDRGQSGGYRRSGSSNGKASWVMFFLAILLGVILPPIGLLLMGVAIVMAILE